VVGEGANGKSVLLFVLTALVGERNVSRVPLELFGEGFQPL
jgi:phage/plasmid-associated DNA primase